MVLRRLVNSHKLRRMEHRGEALIDAEEFWDGFGTLAEDLIPGRDNEISRDRSESSPLNGACAPKKAWSTIHSRFCVISATRRGWGIRTCLRCWK